MGWYNVFYSFILTFIPTFMLTPAPTLTSMFTSTFTSTFTYTPFQILGVLAVVGMAIAVIMYFSTLWSVDRTRNEGSIINTTDFDLHFSGLSKLNSESLPLNVTIKRSDREPVILSGDQIKVFRARYSYDRMVLHISDFTVDDRHYTLDKIIEQNIRDNTVSIVGEYSCDASFLEDNVDFPYEVTIKYTDTGDIIPYLNRMYSDELTHLYMMSDFSFLEIDSSSYPDILQSKLLEIRNNMLGLIDSQTGVRSMLFIMFYKLLDPKFRSIGLESIRYFTILMSMHIEFLRMIQNDELFNDDDDDNTHEEIDQIFRSIITIEDGLRRFVSKCVTSKNCRSDILEIMDRYFRLLRNPNVPSLDFKIMANMSDESLRSYKLADTDIKITCIACRMYGDILIKLADPDSKLYTEQISRLYALIAPLYSLKLADDMTIRIDSSDLDIRTLVITDYVTQIPEENNKPPSDLIQMLRSTKIASRSKLSFQDGINLLLHHVWKTYNLNPRAIATENQDTYRLLKQI